MGENGKVKHPAWMQIADAEKRAIDIRLTAKVAAMSEEEQQSRWQELRDAPDSYETLLESTKLVFGSDEGIS